MADTYGVGYGGVSVHGGGDPSSMLAHGATLAMGGGMPYDPGPEAGRCHHRKADGGYCGRYPKGGSLYCPLHKTAGEMLDLVDAALNED